MLSKSEIARFRELGRRRRARREAGRFVVEGRKLVDEVLGSGLTVVQVVASEEAEDGYGPDAVRVPGHVLERIASTSAPQPVVAEVEIPAVGWDALDGAAGPVLVLVDVNDPGNVGTLARSAEAAGFGALVALGATADPWGPKAVRAGAGALFRLTVVEDADAAAGLAMLGERGFQRVGTRMDEAVPCDELDLSGQVAIVMGSEAHGLGDAHVEAIDAWTAIPMPGPTESLNVAMAGTILSYEIARQRRSAR